MSKQIKCPQCNELFTTKPEYEKTFCSISCSNKSRRIRPEKVVVSRGLWLQQKAAASVLFMITTPFDDLGWDVQRRRVIHEQDNKCNRCGLNKWQGEVLSLEIDHKDGNNQNNIRINLEGLCPNCHSLTPTWRGRNKVYVHVTDEKLGIALRDSKSVRQGLKSVGLAGKGANYKRAKRLLTEMTMTWSRGDDHTFEEAAIFNSMVCRKIRECNIT